MPVESKVFKIKVGEVVPVFENRRRPALSVSTDMFNEVLLHLSDGKVHVLHRGFPMNEIKYDRELLAALGAVRRTLLALDESVDTDLKHDE